MKKKLKILDTCVFFFFRLDAGLSSGRASSAGPSVVDQPAKESGRPAKRQASDVALGRNGVDGTRIVGVRPRAAGEEGRGRRRGKASFCSWPWVMTKRTLYTRSCFSGGLLAFFLLSAFAFWSAADAPCSRHFSLQSFLRFLWIGPPWQSCFKPRQGPGPRPTRTRETRSFNCGGTGPVQMDDEQQ